MKKKVGGIHMKKSGGFEYKKGGKKGES